MTNIFTINLADKIKEPKVIPLYARRGANETTMAFIAVGDAVIKELLELDDDTVSNNSIDSKSENGNLAGWIEGRGRTIVHCIGSVVPHFVSVNNRNLFVPSYCLKDSHRVNRLFIAYFIDDNPANTQPTEARVAGWATAGDVIESKSDNGSRPITFVSSLDVVSFPVYKLRDMSTLPGIDVYGEV